MVDPRDAYHMLDMIDQDLHLTCRIRMLQLPLLELSLLLLLALGILQLELLAKRRLLKQHSRRLGYHKTREEIDHHHPSILR